MTYFGRLLVTLATLLSIFTVSAISQEAAWETVETTGQPTARHEAALVAYKGKLYLIGGRRVNPVDVYDPTTKTWTAKSETPIELHHFQAVVYGDAIYMIGAMTGGWPKETPLEKVVVYYPEKDKFKFVHTIPKSRRRGGAGAVVYEDKIYIVGGITNGHMDGSQSWLDSYNPKTGDWTPLHDAPHPRDHFAAAVVDNKLYAAAGRTTMQRTNQGFDLTVGKCDVYDLEKGIWQSNDLSSTIPTQRAGNLVASIGGRLVVGGGESGTQKKAHSEVEAFDPTTQTWTSLPSLNRGRHGSAFAVIGDYLYTASGCGNRGGSPELTSLERIKLPLPEAIPFDVAKGHTKTLSFFGPNTSELATPNPFTDYRLTVKLTHPTSGQSFSIRGFYAADGDPGNTSADSGNVWQARFAPSKTGQWNYSATLLQGKDIAIGENKDSASAIELQNAKGSFSVGVNQRSDTDFRSRGRIVADRSHFRFENTGQYWLKGGTDSPENLLAFEDFDGTFRIKASNKDGEASTDEQIHSYPTHVADWNEGDPTWGEANKGKAIIGAFNYLASKGINSSYFLTLNIKGDGKDVWPYVAPDDFTRFDCSKLDQWEIVFEHMQSKGIMLHVQTQETENETMLDGGDTGRLRKLYYQELISRFAHHPALVWNLGEENGPAEWTPIGQTPKQRIAMADYIKASDPYNHPVVMHTHADEHSKKELLMPLLNAKSIDGLSFQVDKPEAVHGEILKWFELSAKSDHRWLIAMDEIGPWMHGVVPDDEAENHNQLRHKVLWGSLMAGAAGVEWYFGAKHPHNDLTSEDWRQRERMWELTTIARKFFEQHLPWWQMTAADELLSAKDGYCFAKPGEVYAVYLPNNQTAMLDLANESGEWTIKWFSPTKGGDLMTGSQQISKASEAFSLGSPPDSKSDQDWAVLIRPNDHGAADAAK